MRAALQAVSLTASLSPYPALFYYCANVNSCKGPEASFSSLLGQHFGPSLFLTAIESLLPALFPSSPPSRFTGSYITHPPPFFFFPFLTNFSASLWCYVNLVFFLEPFPTRTHSNTFPTNTAIKQSPDVGNLWVPPLVCFPVKQLWHLFHGGRGDYISLA